MSLSLRSRLLVCLVLPTAFLVLPAGRAVAVIHPSAVLVGPGSDILDVDGTALAPDGSGGVVYREQVEGIDHVFVVPFLDGRWGTPIRVDREDPYGATQPAIAAGEDGRLLVVWVQPRNTSPTGVLEYALLGAFLQPGSGGFGPAHRIDANVGEPATGDVSNVDPTLAMAPDGSAYVVYRVVTDDCGPFDVICPVGQGRGVLLDVRVAYFHELWHSVGAVNRAPQLGMRAPTAADAPAIAIDPEDNGLVAWQEPGADGVARIWVRRLFGTVQGNVLEASPQAISGRPITSDADAPAVALGPSGEGRVAFRIEGAPGSAVAAPELWLEAIGSSFEAGGAKLDPPAEIATSTQGDLGPPSLALGAKGLYRLAWSQDAAAFELGGGEGEPSGPLALGSASGTAPVPTTVDPDGGGTSATTTEAAGAPFVAVREDYPAGASQSAELAGPQPGPIAGLSLAGSAAGALLGWAQGQPGQIEVVGDYVQSTPPPVRVSVPKGWVRSPRTTLRWTAEAPTGGDTYSVYVDGRPVARDLTGSRAELRSRSLGDGVHHVEVIAEDGAGQRTAGASALLRVDTEPPIVHLAPFDRRRGVTVHVGDAGSGVAAGKTTIEFGDGAHTSGRAIARHLYRRPGSYRILVNVCDRAGNRATAHLAVRVR